VLPGALALGGVAGLSFWLLRDHPYFHVAAVRVYGVERVSPQEVLQRAHLQPGVSLWRIDPAAVRRRLLQHPWIRDVLVQRLFPNAVELIVYERKPSAVLGGQAGPAYVIDADGYILGPASAHEAAALPRLVVGDAPAWTPGQRLTDAGVMTGLRIVQQIDLHPFFRGAGVSQLEILPAERFRLRTRRGTFTIGADVAAATAKLDYIAAVDEVLRARGQRLEAIDLTFAKQIVVKTNTSSPPGAVRRQKRGSASGQTQ
jgi:cell division protein FtsQ